MYVFLSDIFYKFLLTPIFKKLDAFIPALSLLLNLFLSGLFTVCVPQTKDQTKKVVPTPVCFFLLYYIYSK